VKPAPKLEPKGAEAMPYDYELISESLIALDENNSLRCKRLAELARSALLNIQMKDIELRSLVTTLQAENEGLKEIHTDAVKHFESNRLNCSDVELKDGDVYYPSQFVIQMMNEFSRMKNERLKEADEIVRRLADTKEATWPLTELAMNYIANNPTKEVKKTDNKFPWISVEDRLPELGEKVLLYFGKIDNVLMGRLYPMEDIFQWKIFFSDGEVFQTFAQGEVVTHWAELPPPPTSPTSSNNQQ